VSSADAFNFFRKNWKIEEKNLKLFMLNNMRLGGYTQWVCFARKLTPFEEVSKI